MNPIEALFFVFIVPLGTFILGILGGQGEGKAEMKDQICRRGFGRYHPVTRQFQWKDGDEWSDEGKKSDGAT